MKAFNKEYRESEEDSEEEFVVEKVGEDDNTWEDETNLNCDNISTGLLEDFTGPNEANDPSCIPVSWRT